MTLISWLCFSMAVQSYSLPVLSFSFLECSTVFLDSIANSVLSLSIISFFSLRIFSILDIRSVMRPPACLAYNAAISCSYVFICLQTFQSYFLSTQPPELKGISFGGYFFTLSFSVCSVRAQLILIISILRRRLRYSSSEMYLPLGKSETVPDVLAELLLVFEARSLSQRGLQELVVGVKGFSVEGAAHYLLQISIQQREINVQWRQLCRTLLEYVRTVTDCAGINYNRMHNKQINTPEKSLRPYLDIMRSSSHKRKSIFSRDHTPSTSKTLRSKDPLKTEPRLKTQPVEHRTTEDLVNEMTELMSKIKTKYNIYLSVQEENGRLKKENAFLQEELVSIRREVAGNQEGEIMMELRKENLMMRDKFRKAQKQIKELRTISKNDDQIVQGFDRLLEILSDQTL